MTNFKTFSLFIISVFFTTAISACQSVDVRGQFVSDKAIAEINAVKPDHKQLVNMIGTPTFIPDYTDNVWYYIQRSMSRKAWFDPKVVSQRIVKVTFTKNKKVADARLIDNMHDENIDVNSSYTKTRGTEQNGIQKFVKNIGRFNQTTGGGSSRRKNK